MRSLSLVMTGAVLLLIVSVFLGRYPQPLITSFYDLMTNDLAKRIIIDIRIPRILLSFILGMVLAASGMVFQMIFRNPLVDAGFLGVSGGAAFGASFAIVLLSGRVYEVQICAALFAIGGLVASCSIAARIRYGDWVLRLVLSGIAIAAIYASGLGVLKYLADPLHELPDLTFWMLGGLWAVTWPDTIQILLITVPCLCCIWMMRWRLNLLSMRDETSYSLLSAPGKERIFLLVCAVIATSAVVAKAGQIGWVGLIVPHISRRIAGSDSAKALPYSMVVGGIFVLVCDDISRTLLTGEIPLGILTSLIGAAVFLGLFMKRPMLINKGIQ